jgi:hypothetical protein
MTKSGVKTAHSEFNKFITSILNTEKLPKKWKEFITPLSYKMYDKT